MAEEVVRIGKRCYVGNLAWKTSWQDLKDKFRECGNVVYANVMKDDAGARRARRSFARHVTPIERPLTRPPHPAPQAAPRAGASWSSRPPRR